MNNIILKRIKKSAVDMPPNYMHMMEAPSQSNQLSNGMTIDMSDINGKTQDKSAMMNGKYVYIVEFTVPKQPAPLASRAIQAKLAQIVTGGKGTARPNVDYFASIDGCHVKARLQSPLKEGQIRQLLSACQDVAIEQQDWSN